MRPEPFHTFHTLFTPLFTLVSWCNSGVYGEKVKRVKSKLYKVIPERNCICVYEKSLGLFFSPFHFPALFYCLAGKYKSEMSCEMCEKGETWEQGRATHCGTLLSVCHTKPACITAMSGQSALFWGHWRHHLFRSFAQAELRRQLSKLLILLGLSLSLAGRTVHTCVTISRILP